MIKKIIIALLHDVRRTHGDVFNSKSLRNTIKTVSRRLDSEGSSFLTKALPRLGKALDKALCHQHNLNATELRFKPLPGTQLPMLFGELFKKVLAADGSVLQNPCVDSVRTLRVLTYCFYKYKLPYSDEQEQKVVSAFESAEDELRVSDERLDLIERVTSRNGCLGEDRQTDLSNGEIRCKRLANLDSPTDRLEKGEAFNELPPYSADQRVKPRHCKDSCKSFCDLQRVFTDYGYDAVRLEYQHRLTCRARRYGTKCHVVEQDSGPTRSISQVDVVRRAREVLKLLFALFDPKDIYPKHGPGAVATKQRLWNKYSWTNVSANITATYPLDEYFYSSLGHVCDAQRSIMNIGDESLPARVILVPKDSRGPRLISAEPVDNQWIQQGLSVAIRDHVEKHELTKFNVFFTNQQPNQFGALLGSSTGKYATLDLKEASDRVSLRLVRLLFPEWLMPFLESCRSSSTVLPDGRILKLRKFAPMGSALCFPILALTIWAILHAAAPDTDTQQSILVYGDDVIVPTAFAADAIEQLESFGLLVNRDKSCTKGFFRESCGVDAFKGVDVTPTKIRTVWSSLPSADVFESYIEYSNEFFEDGFLCTSELIARELGRIYGPIPTSDMGLPCASLHIDVLNNVLEHKWHPHLYKVQYRCLVSKSPRISFEAPGWEQLLRYFAEAANKRNAVKARGQELNLLHFEGIEPFCASAYTRRDTAKLLRRWVSPIWKLIEDPYNEKLRRECDDPNRLRALNKYEAGLGKDG